MINYDKMKSNDKMESMVSCIIRRGCSFKSRDEIEQKFKEICWEGQFLYHDDVHLNQFASLFGYICSQDRYIHEQNLETCIHFYLDDVALGQETDTSLVEVAKQIIEDMK